MTMPSRTVGATLTYRDCWDSDRDRMSSPIPTLGCSIRVAGVTPGSFFAWAPCGRSSGRLARGHPGGRARGGLELASPMAGARLIGRSAANYDDEQGCPVAERL